MIITLQLIKNQFIDTDEESGFSLKWTNPFFCVGVTNVSHTQDLSVPATENNNKIFNLDNIAIAEGWRHGRQCWMGFSGGELEGRLFIKDYEKGRYNLLFMYGSELDPNFEIPIADLWQPQNSLVISSPKLDPVPTDFGWMDYNELYGGGNFGNGMSMLPAVNLGWMMDELATAANYSITIDGVALSSVADDQYNPYNYGVILDSAKAGTTYSLALNNFSAGDNMLMLNHQFYDSLSNPVSDAAAGIQMTQKNLWWLYPTVGTYWVFEALRPVTIILPASNSVAVRVNAGGYPGTTDPYNEPWIHNQVRLDLSAGMYFTIFYILDYQYDGIYGITPFNYNMQVIDSVEDAQLSDTIVLADNLPNMTFLEIIRNYCLMTSSYYIIDGDNAAISIYTINNVISNGFSNGSDIMVEGSKKLLDVGSLYRYIDGFSQHNRVGCKSASYVVDGQDFSTDYPCNNDLLDDSSEFGQITFNEGNFNFNANNYGEAVMQNVEVNSSNDIVLKPTLSIVFANTLGGHSYHIQYVENSYGMSNGLASITANASSIDITIREYLYEFLQHNPEDVIHYGGRYWLAQDATFQDNATQLKLVSVDAALAPQPQPYQMLSYIESDGTQYIDTGYQPNNTTYIYMDFQPTKNEINANNPFSLVNDNGITFGIADLDSDNYNIYYYSYNNGVIKLHLSPNTQTFLIQRHVSILDQPNHYCELDANYSYYSFYTSTFQLNYNLPIFAYNNSGTITYGWMKLYEYKIEDNGVLVRHFKPAKRLSDQVVGLLDVVNDVFYTNQGTGTFSYA